MRGIWEELRIAGGFLTVFPGVGSVPTDSRRLGRSMAFFPAIGLALGGLLAGVDRGLAPLFPASVLDALLVLVLILATGALHLDGLADTVDGLAGGRGREDALRIMKDSRVGAMGAVALVMVLLLKYLSLHALPAPQKTAALVLMPAAGRWAPVVLAALCPYVRPGGGTGAFSDHVGGREVAIATATVVLAASVLFGTKALLFLPLLALTVLGMARYFKARLGGVTGDLLGAASELTEVLALMLLLSLGSP